MQILLVSYWLTLVENFRWKFLIGGLLLSRWLLIGWTGSCFSLAGFYCRFYWFLVGGFIALVGQGDGWVFEEEKKKRGREICEGGRDRFNVNKLYEIHVTIGDEKGGGLARHSTLFTRGFNF